MKYLDNRGFTLIELLIAITILAIGLLAVAGLRVAAIKGNAHGNTISQATSLAEDRIEAIRNMDYANIYAPNPHTEANLDGTIYTRETVVEDDTPLPDLKRVTVTVRWNSHGPHQVVLRTIVANGG